MDEPTAVLEQAPTRSAAVERSPADHQAMTTVRTLVHGRWKAQALGAALRLGVAAAVADRELTAKEVADELGTDPDRMSRLLALLTAMGVLRRADGRYRLAAAAERLLPAHPATAARDAAYSLSPGFGATWAGLAEMVRGGARPAPVPTTDPAAQAYQAGVLEKNLNGLLETFAISHGARVAAPGPHGAELLELLAQRRPGLACLPGEAVGAADVYLLPHVLHDLTDRAARELLRDIATTAPAGAAVVVLAAALRDVDPHLLCAYLDVAQMLSTAHGRERTESEYQALFAAAGFAAANVTDVVGRPGIVLLVSRVCAAG